jgi:hypothetical protein
MTRSIGNEIFKTIVEMSYEMAYCERADREYAKCREILDEFYDGVQTNKRKKKRALRSYQHTKGETFRSQPFQRMGIPLFFSIHMEYERYTDTQNKIRERGIFTITVSKNERQDLRHYSRFRYESDEQWLTEKAELKAIFIGGLGYLLWGRPSKKQKNWCFPLLIKH